MWWLIFLFCFFHRELRDIYFFDFRVGCEHGRSGIYFGWSTPRPHLANGEFGRCCCRETIRRALHRLKLSWKKARKLLGRADPGQREAFIAEIGPLLDGARDERHHLVYLDEAHIHQDVELGYGWGERGKRFHVASSSPGLKAKVSFYGLSLYNEGQVRIWPYTRANGAHTIDVLRR